MYFHVLIVCYNEAIRQRKDSSEGNIKKEHCCGQTHKAVKRDVKGKKGRHKGNEKSNVLNVTSGCDIF